MCKVEWCNHAPNKSGKGYCRRHYDQIRQHGKILDKRSINDPNRFNIVGETAEIIITDRNDQYRATAIIDRADLQRVLEHRWTMNSNGYARTFVGTTPLYLHRFVVGEIPEGREVDHINRNKMDNRSSNLRVVTHVENSQNKEYRGSVRLVKGRSLKKPYCAGITAYKKYYHLGYYETEEEAKVAIESFKIGGPNESSCLHGNTKLLSVHDPGSKVSACSLRC